MRLLAWLAVPVLLGQTAGRDVVKEKRAAMAKALAAEVERGNPPLDEPVVREYVVGVVRRLVPDGEFRVAVMDADAAGALALPGGLVYVTRGLLEKSATEADIAAVIAAELSREWPVEGPVIVNLDLSRRKPQTSAEAVQRAAAMVTRAGYESRSTLGNQIDRTVTTSRFQEVQELLAERRARQLKRQRPTLYR